MTESVGDAELKEVLGGIVKMIEEDTITVPRFKYMLLGTYVTAAQDEIRKKDELISKMVWVLREIIVAADSLNGIDDNASFAYQMRHSGLKVGHIRKTDRGHRIRRINIRPLKGDLV